MRQVVLVPFFVARNIQALLLHVPDTEIILLSTQLQKTTADFNISQSTLSNF